MLPSKDDSFPDVVRRSRVDADDRHAPLLTRKAERSVEVAALDRPVRKDVCLPVGVFGGPRLIRTPETVEPARLDVGAATCSGVVTRGGWWDWVYQWLRNFRCERLEFGSGWPTSRFGCTAAVLGRRRSYRRQAESDGQERCQEKHGCWVQELGELVGIYTTDPTTDRARCCCEALGPGAMNALETAVAILGSGHCDGFISGPNVPPWR